MFQSDDIIIKNEPITDEETEFATEKLLFREIDIKSEDTERTIKIENSIDFMHQDDAMQFFAENEYVADQMIFGSIIVKEEPKLNVSDKSAGLEQSMSLLNPSFNCVNDDKVIQKQAGGKKKFTTNKKILECYICKECFPKDLYDLRRHIKTHTDEKPFACDECERKFQRKANLNQHKLIHTGEKSFACDQCDRKCLRKSTLDRHKKTHTGEKSFTCNQCDQKFSRNSTLSQHKLIHTGENPFACDQCDRKFRIKSTLAYHKQTHTGEKQFNCDKCDRKYSNKLSLNQHKRIHKKAVETCEKEADKLSSYDQCNPESSTKRMINQHKRTHMDKRTNGTRTVKKKTKYAVLMKKCQLLRNI